MPLIKSKARAFQPTSILKSTKRESVVANSSVRPSNLDPRNAPPRPVKLGSFPPPAPPLPDKSAFKRPRREKRRPWKRTGKETPKDAGNGLDKPALEAEDSKFMQIHEPPKVPNRNAPNIPSISSSTSKDRSVTEESRNVKDPNAHKIESREGSPNPGKNSQADGENVNDNERQGVVKQNSSALFVPKKLSVSLSTPSGSTSDESMGTENVYGGLIGFENAILETGDDQVDIKRATIKRIRSKRYAKGTRELCQ